MCWLVDIKQSGCRVEVASRPGNIICASLIIKKKKTLSAREKITSRKKDGNRGYDSFKKN